MEHKLYFCPKPKCFSDLALQHASVHCYSTVSMISQQNTASSRVGVRKPATSWFSHSLLTSLQLKEATEMNTLLVSHSQFGASYGADSFITTLLKSGWSGWVQSSVGWWDSDGERAAIILSSFHLGRLPRCSDARLGVCQGRDKSALRELLCAGH